MDGGSSVAEALARHDVRFLFTLCGGHISPILVGAKERGIRVVDVRHEATAVYAADAVSRLSGVPGVAVVTAGPGLTNSVTAVKNAQLAQSPLVLLGGSAPTVLKGKGALQDIDQMALMKPHVKWAESVRKVGDIGPALQKAFAIAQSGVPGPVFLEFPIDVLYPEELVREWYAAKPGKGLAGKAQDIYLARHLDAMFADGGGAGTEEVRIPRHDDKDLATVFAKLCAAERPVILLGSQAVRPEYADALSDAVASLGVPVYLSGMARGLLGKEHELLFRHRRKEALKNADLVILAGVPCDFRLDYGRQLRGYISLNRSRDDLYLNRKPDVAVHADPGGFLLDLAKGCRAHRKGWLAQLRQNEGEREQEIAAAASEKLAGINPVAMLRTLDGLLEDDAVLVGDGGDFVGTASYTLRPRAPLGWLDPGPFGTLGVGAGFALGAKLCNPGSEVWVLYGDGACGFSIAEQDTFVRHGLGVISLVGNDGAWNQIARDQVEYLKDDVGTQLSQTDYDAVARGFGAQGRRAESLEDFVAGVREAQDSAANGMPYLLNAVLGRSDFRKGSVSM